MSTNIVTENIDETNLNIIQVLIGLVEVGEVSNMEVIDTILHLSAERDKYTDPPPPSPPMLHVPTDEPGLVEERDTYTDPPSLPPPMLHVPTDEPRLVEEMADYEDESFDNFMQKIILEASAERDKYTDPPPPSPPMLHVPTDEPRLIEEKADYEDESAPKLMQKILLGALDNYEIESRENLEVNVSFPNLRLFVGNIPKSKSKEEIFEEFGKLTVGLTEVIIYSSPDDKRKNRGFCFLEYESYKAASLAKEKLGTGRIKVWGCDIFVDWADPQEEPDEETMAKVKILYARNLTAELTEEKLKEMFEEYGKVDKVKKIKDYAFIHFAERDPAVKAMEEVNGKEFGGSTVEVSLAKPPYDKKKKEEVLRNREHRMTQILGRGGGMMGMLPTPPRGRGGRLPPNAPRNIDYDYDCYAGYSSEYHAGGGGYGEPPYYDDFYAPLYVDFGYDYGYSIPPGPYPPTLPSPFPPPPEIKNYEIPNISQHEESVFNSGSNKDNLVTVKIERESPEPPEASAITKDFSYLQTTSESGVRKHENINKKRRVCPKCHCRKRIKYERRSSHLSDDDPHSESYVHYSVSKNRRLVSCSSDSSDDGSRSPTRKKEYYVSDSKYHGRSRYKKNYDDGSDSHSRRYRKRSSSRERERSRNQRKKRYECSSDSDTSSNNLSLKCYKYSSDASTRNRSKKNYKNSSHSDDDSYYKKGKSHSKKLGAIDKRQFDFRKYLLAPSALFTNRVAKEEYKNLESPHGDYHRKPPSKYPECRLGYYREKLDVPSSIQGFLDNRAKFPCPGLHKVTEIRGPQPGYYCAFCDCICSDNSIVQHLSGYQHQRNSLKYYRSDLFEKWSNKFKNQIPDEMMIEILYEVENKYGKGTIKVDQDFKGPKLGSGKESICQERIKPKGDTRSSTLKLKRDSSEDESPPNRNMADLRSKLGSRKESICHGRIRRKRTTRSSTLKLKRDSSEDESPPNRNMADLRSKLGSRKESICHGRIRRKRTTRSSTLKRGSSEDESPPNRNMADLRSKLLRRKESICHGRIRRKSATRSSKCSPIMLKLKRDSSEDESPPNRNKDTYNIKAETEMIDWNIRDKPSTSYECQDTNFYKAYKLNSQPDPNKSGFYCKLCEAQCNSELTWNTHIIGKKHIANLRKNPGM